MMEPTNTMKLASMRSQGLVITFLTITCLALAATSVTATDLGTLIEGPDDDDHAIVLREFAEQGNADAQFALGLMLGLGEGVEEDKQEAARWYRIAAEQGHADAQFALGLMYDHGIGVVEDVQEAATHFRQAALQGHADAQLVLGLMHLSGAGVEEDRAEAAAWIHAAVRNGHAEAQPMLDLLLETGRSESGVNVIPDGCATTDAEGGIGLAADCPGFGNAIRLSVQPHHLSEWKCDILLRDDTPIDGEVRHECRSLYQSNAVRRVSCNPHFADCSFPVRQARLGSGTKAAPWEPMSWPHYLGLDLASSWEPDSLQLADCNPPIPMDGSTPATICLNPSYQRLVLAPTLPEIRCFVVSDYTQIDGAVTIECLSLYGVDAKRIACGPRDAERCLRLTSTRAHDGHALPHASAEADSRSLPHEMKPTAISPTSDAYDSFPGALIDPVDDPSECNSIAAIDEFPPKDRCHDKRPETLTVALVPPEWQCTVANETKGRDESVTFQCYSIFDEAVAIRCDRNRLAECSLPAEPREQLDDDFKKVPPEILPLSPNSVMRMLRRPTDVTSLQIGREHEWKCITDGFDNSLIDGVITVLCLSRYRQKKSISVSLTAPVQSPQPIMGEPIVGGWSIGNPNDEDDLHTSPDSYWEMQGWAEREKGRRSFTSESGVVLPSPFQAERAMSFGETERRVEEEVDQRASRTGLNADEFDRPRSLNPDLHEFGARDEISRSIRTFPIYFEAGEVPTRQALERILHSSPEKTELFGPEKTELSRANVRRYDLDLPKEFLEFAALALLDLVGPKGLASASKAAKLLAKSRKKGLGPHWKRSIKKHRKLSRLARVEKAIRKERLPPKPRNLTKESQTGYLYYVPPKGYSSGRLPRKPARHSKGKMKGFEDMDGNVWIKGTGTNRKGVTTKWNKEWDVQLSPNLQKVYGKRYLNVTMDGKILPRLFRRRPRRPGGRDRRRMQCVPPRHRRLGVGRGSGAPGPVDSRMERTMRNPIFRLAAALAAAAMLASTSALAQPSPGAPVPEAPGPIGMPPKPPGGCPEPGPFPIRNIEKNFTTEPMIKGPLAEDACSWTAQ